MANDTGLDPGPHRKAQGAGTRRTIIDMYIRSITIEDLRSIESERIDFLYAGRDQDEAFADVRAWPPRLPNLTLLVGNNGSGKTTILDAVALAILSPILASSGYRPYALVRRRPDGSVAPAARLRGEIIMHETEAPVRPGKQEAIPIDLAIERRGDIEILPSSSAAYGGPLWSGMFEDRSPSFFLVGYGAQRRAEILSSTDMSARRKSRALRYERVASLFEDQFPLMPLSAWLPTLKDRDPARFEETIDLLGRLLPEGISFLNRLEGGEYLFRYRDTAVPFSALSDGFRAYISWIGDLLYHLGVGEGPVSPLDKRRGVVLVDEIDILVHPRWQRTMMHTLSSALPNLQFIFTTHSPLIVGSLERANIYFVGGPSTTDVMRPPEEVYGLSADQVLRSDVFGLDSTRDPEFQEQLDDLSRRVTAGEPGAARKLMHSAALGAGIDSSLDDDDGDDLPPDWVLRRASGGHPKGV
jgi:energy-coupling factor transporter ATP-binding protein EcfA2